MIILVNVELEHKGEKKKESKREKPIFLVFSSLGNTDYLDESAQ